jgi:hypothetical protein
MTSFIEADETVYTGAGSHKSIDTCEIRFEKQTVVFCTLDLMSNEKIIVIIGLDVTVVVMPPVSR